MKESEKKFLAWNDCYHQAFEAVKSIVISRDCLIVIDLLKLSEYKIFVTTDASNKCSGAVLSLGKTWNSAVLLLLIQWNSCHSMMQKSFMSKVATIQSLMRSHACLETQQLKLLKTLHATCMITVTTMRALQE